MVNVFWHLIFYGMLFGCLQAKQLAVGAHNLFRVQQRKQAPAPVGSWRSYGQNSCVRLRVRTSDTKVNTGTGFFLRAGGVLYLVTAHHVVARAREVHAVLYLGQVQVHIPVQQVAMNIGVDLALFQLRASDQAVLERALNTAITPLPLGDGTRLRKGAPVVHLGYAGNATQLVERKGNFLEIRSHNYYDKAFLLTSAPVEAGMSGGPCLDAQGNVIGVLYGSASLRTPGGRAEAAMVSRLDVHLPLLLKQVVKKQLT